MFDGLTGTDRQHLIALTVSLQPLVDAPLLRQRADIVVRHAAAIGAHSAARFADPAAVGGALRRIASIADESTAP